MISFRNGVGKIVQLKMELVDLEIHGRRMRYVA